MFAYRSSFNRSQPVSNARIGGVPGSDPAQTYVRAGTVLPVTSTTPTPRFGTSSMNLNTTSTSYIQTTSPTPTFTNVGSGDFAVEGWIYFSTKPTVSRELIYGPASDALGIRIGQTNGSINVNALAIFGGPGGTTRNYDYAPIVWATGKWYYFCVQRRSGVISFWVGTNDGGNTVGTYIAPIAGAQGSASGVNFAIAGFSGVRIGSAIASPRCYVNEIQTTIGSRYPITNANIVLPTAFLPVDQYTTQEMRFQGADGGTTFNNTTS
jgi:hypothetical protein